MASNKNQHFVPRCYLRPFTINAANLAINLFNIDRLKFIERAAVKHQCSGDYFYGQSDKLESAMQLTESAYASALREILLPGYSLTDSHRVLLRRFWLFQHLRTEAASMRSVEMAEATNSVIGLEAESFRLGIKEAVQFAMKTFAEEMHAVDDLKICLVRNRTRTPFITSDDPAPLTNRWQLGNKRTKGLSFGVHSAGAIILLPLSPSVLCLGYDGDVYSVPHEAGWVEARRDADISAFNRHQFLNCRANVFVRDSADALLVQDAFSEAAPLRPKARYVINYAVLDAHEGNSTRYRVVDPALAGDHEEAIVHSQTIHAHPILWPRQISWRSKGAVFTNDTGLGYVRHAGTLKKTRQVFRKETPN